MTSDQIGALAERFAYQAIEMVGPDDAPGVMLQSLILAHLKHHSLDALVFCLERTVAALRADLVKQLGVTGSVQ